MKKLQIRGVKFCLGVEDVSGVVDVLNGFAMFRSPERNLIANLPFGVDSSAYGQKVVATLYAGTNRIVTGKSEDHVFLEDMKQGDIDLLNNIDGLYDALEDEKMKNIPKVMQDYLSVVSCVLALIVSYFCRGMLQRTWYWFMLVAAIILVWSLIRASSLTKVLNSCVIYDDYDHWVDLDTGETNLAGGFKVPVERREDFL